MPKKHDEKKTFTWHAIFFDIEFQHYLRYCADNSRARRVSLYLDTSVLYFVNTVQSAQKRVTVERLCSGTAQLHERNTMIEV